MKKLILILAPLVLLIDFMYGYQFAKSEYQLPQVEDSTDIYFTPLVVFQPSERHLNCDGHIFLKKDNSNVAMVRCYDESLPKLAK